MRTAYRLTITKVIDNVLFMKSIRHMFGNFSLIEASNIGKNKKAKNCEHKNKSQ